MVRGARAGVGVVAMRDQLCRVVVEEPVVLLRDQLRAALAQLREAHPHDHERGGQPRGVDERHEVAGAFERRSCRSSCTESRGSSRDAPPCRARWRIRAGRLVMRDEAELLRGDHVDEIEPDVGSCWCSRRWRSRRGRPRSSSARMLSIGKPFSRSRSASSPRHVSRATRSRNSRSSLGSVPLSASGRAGHPTRRAWMCGLRRLLAAEGLLPRLLLLRDDAGAQSGWQRQCTESFACRAGTLCGAHHSPATQVCPRVPQRSAWTHPSVRRWRSPMRADPRRWRVVRFQILAAMCRVGVLRDGRRKNAAPCQ